MNRIITDDPEVRTGAKNSFLAQALPQRRKKAFWGGLPPLICLFLLRVGVLGAEEPAGFFPREYATIPVNGTEKTENPVALRHMFQLGGRASNNVFECGDHISFLEDIIGAESPHTDWAVPYAGPRPRILAFAGHRGFARDVLELRQRCDFDFVFALRPMMYHYAGYRHPSILRHFRERYRLLLEENWDALLLPANDTLNLLDEETLPRIAEKIRAGTPALLLLNASDWNRKEYDATRPLFQAISPLSFEEGEAGQSHFDTSGAPDSPIVSEFCWSLWPRNTVVTKARLREGATMLVRRDGSPVVAEGMYGQGRVMAIVLPEIPHGAGTQSMYDTGGRPLTDDVYELAYSLILKGLLCTLAEEPRLRLRLPETVSVASGRSPALSVDILGKVQPLGDFRMEYRLKGPWGEVADRGHAEVTEDGGEAICRLSLPALSLNGLYRLDLWLKRGGKVETWGHAAILVEKGPGFRVERRGGASRPGEEATFQVHTDGRSGALHILGVDGADRVFFDQSVPVKDGDTVRIDTSLSLQPYNRVTFSFRDEQEHLAGRDVADLFVPRIGMESLGGEYCILSYGRPSVAPHLLRTMGDLYRAAGFNTIYYHWHSRHRVCETAQTGLASITGFILPQIKQSNFENELAHCFNNPGVIEQWKQNAAEAIADIEDYGSIARVIDDECYAAFTGYREGDFVGAQRCQCTHCLGLFRKYLQAAYGDIGALNDAWGSDHADFQQVRVMEESKINALGNPSGWLEFRQFMNRMYAENYYGRIESLHAPLGQTFRTGPGAPNYTSAEGGPTYRGGDYGELKETLRFMMAYGGPESEVFPDMFVGQPAAQKYDPPLCWKEWGPWQALLRGADALWFYSGKQIVGGEIGWRKHAEWIEQGCHDIARGMGVLIRDAEPLNKDVCILYSPENLAMGWLFGKRRDRWKTFALAGGQARSTGTFQSLLRDHMNMQPRMITAQDIAKGRLAQCKLLFLPAIFNMSDETAERIAQWVRGGGCLVADVLPATRERWGKPRAQSALADLFGVNASKARLQVESKQWYSVGTHADSAFCPDILWLPGDTTFVGIEPTTAKSFGRMLSREGEESDILFINQYGDGQAILFNFVFAGLHVRSSEWFRQFGEALLRKAGVRAPARIVDPETAAPLPYYPLYAFAYGKAQLLASIRGSLMRSGGRPILTDMAGIFAGGDRVRLQWAGKRHVYAPRQRKYLGYADSAVIDAPAFHASLLSTLPYKVETVEIIAPATAGPGAPCFLQARVVPEGEAEVGAHVLYMDVESPTGNRIPLYCRTLAAEAGVARFSIPFALNDRPGEWRVRIRDVLSGTEATHSILLQGQVE